MYFCFGITFILLLLYVIRAMLFFLIFVGLSSSFFSSSGRGCFCSGGDGLAYHADPVLDQGLVLAGEPRGVTRLGGDCEREGILAKFDRGVREENHLARGVEWLRGDCVVVREEGALEDDVRTVGGVEDAARLCEDAFCVGVAEGVEVWGVVRADELAEVLRRRDGGGPRDLVEVRLQQAGALLDEGGVCAALEDVATGKLGERLLGELEAEVQV